ncbi:MAG TPA: META domain-containing protein [Candidatus Eisenbacteria bacterium]
MPRLFNRPSLRAIVAVLCLASLPMGSTGCNQKQGTSAETTTGGHALAGSWQATLPAASSPGRTITLMLNPDMTARMTTEYQNGEPPIVAMGTWRPNGREMAEVTLKREGHNAAPTTMSFRADANSLTAVDFDKDMWGSAGLKLTRTGGPGGATVGGDRNPAGLAGSGWEWTNFSSPTENLSVPDPVKYTLEFAEDGNVAILAACNRGGGPVKLGDGTISINLLRLTRMACPPGSLDARYTSLLTRVATWSLVNGQLVMEIPAESSVLRFRRVK